MARIKIEDLPVLEDLSVKEKKGIFGGSLSYSFKTSGSVMDQISSTADTVEGFYDTTQSLITELEGMKSTEEPKPDSEADGTTKK